jgi:hypothetical protein
MPTARLSAHKNGWRECAYAILDGRLLASNGDTSCYSEASAIRSVIVQLSQRSDADAKTWLALYEQGAVTVETDRH